MIAGFALCLALLVSVPVMADEAKVLAGVKLDAEKLAGINLPSYEQFVVPEKVLDGNHQPRGEVLHYGDQLIVEVYEDDPATFLYDEPWIYDEFVTILSGKLILTTTGGEPQEYVAGDNLVVPKGFTGTWQMLGNYRELVAIERTAFEKAYGSGEE